ncbi:hypothetical protein OPIT5_16685 [Opitutaceae bacterium TAV5]|nr:hypothetical protein OPIT5_16685 [Opitutaceae bacterium TAV5]
MATSSGADASTSGFFSNLFSGVLNTGTQIATTLVQGKVDQKAAENAAKLAATQAAAGTSQAATPATGTGSKLSPGYWIAFVAVGVVALISIVLIARRR